MPLRHLDTWIFDLDNTLYPAHLTLWAQIDAAMKGFIQYKLNLNAEDAFKLQKSYYQKYGTTLRGLMIEHQMDEEEFLKAAHAIDLSEVCQDLPLIQAVNALKGRKFIFTSGTKEHAGRILQKLGLENAFEAIFDIRDAGFLPKPYQQTYEKFNAMHAISPQKALFVEDLERNLIVPHSQGMKTLLVLPSQKIEREKWEEPDITKAHIDYSTTNLSDFLIKNACE